MVQLYIIFPDTTTRRSTYIHEIDVPWVTHFDKSSDWIVFRAPVRSFLTCSMMCVGQLQCMSYAYSKNTGLCIGGRSRLPHEQIPELADTQGFKFYAFLIDGLYW